VTTIVAIFIATVNPAPTGAFGRAHISGLQETSQDGGEPRQTRRRGRLMRRTASRATGCWPRAGRDGAALSQRARR
jgi:hypothetical protein